jgi:hypothetical protein
MNKIHKVIAVTLNWNNYPDTNDCIRSISNSTYPVHKIIVVDNGSTNDSMQKLEMMYHDNSIMHFKYNKDNLGFACGINQGIRAAYDAGADYIFIINNDALVNSDCLERLVNVIQETPIIGIVGPRIFYHDHPEIVWQGGGFFNYFTGGNVVPEKNKKPYKYTKDSVDSSFLTGCIMLIRREVIDEVGYFDQDIYFYEEDVDFCLRNIRHGFKLRYVPNAVSWHKVDGIKISEFAFYHRAKSRIIVLRKNFSRSYYLYALALHWILFTPYKIYQSFKSAHPMKVIISWFCGSISGIRCKLLN